DIHYYSCPLYTTTSLYPVTTLFRSPTITCGYCCPESPATTSSSSPGGIFEAQPPPCAMVVRRIEGWAAGRIGESLMARAYDGAALGGCGGSPPHESVGAIGERRPADPYPCWSCGDSLGGGGVRVLVGAPVFKTGETEHLGLAGSIPVRLRRNLPREDRPRRAAAARPGRAPPVGPRGGPRAQDGGGRHHERSAA